MRVAKLIQQVINAWQRISVWFGNSIEAPVSMQNQWEPSFLRTMTTGLAHGLVEGRITPDSCILFSCLVTSL